MLTLLPLLLVAAQESAPLVPAGPDKVDLKVLYAGRADSARSDRYAEYLALHFTEVGRADYSRYSAADADGYDVVILDCEIIPRPGRIGMVQAPQLPADYDRATVIIGGTVSAVERGLRAKPDWL